MGTIYYKIDSLVRENSFTSEPVLPLGGRAVFQRTSTLDFEAEQLDE